MLQCQTNFSPNQHTWMITGFINSLIRLKKQHSAPITKIGKSSTPKCRSKQEGFYEGYCSFYQLLGQSKNLWVTHDAQHNNTCEFITGWWFQIFFIFPPTWGHDPSWQIFFKCVVQPPTRKAFITHMNSILWFSSGHYWWIRIVCPEYLFQTV